MGRLKDKVAIITGAASGQGASEARLFAKEGAKVVATDVNEELLNKVVKEINDEFGTEVVLGLKHDVVSEKEWKYVVIETVKKFGKLDILVNNAGSRGKAPANVAKHEGEVVLSSISEHSVDEFKELMDINATGNFIGIKSVMPEMKKNGKGSIINISSLAGLVGGQGNIAYQASKGAQRTMTKAAAIELASFGIRVNSVHPGAVRTPMIMTLGEEYLSAFTDAIPLKMMAEPEDIGYLVLFLASDESRFITGTEIVADGGVTAQ